MKEGLALDHARVDYSGATAPEFHRLLRFTFESKSSVVVCGSTVKVFTGPPRGSLTKLKLE
jgi:hypothetical protein